MVLRTEGTSRPLQRLLAQCEPQFEAVTATAEDDCFWLYSSGSTGPPKAAVHRHRDMVVTSQHFGVETLGYCDGRRLLFRGQTVLRLWTRQQYEFPALGRRHGGVERASPWAGDELPDSSNDFGRRSILAFRPFMPPTCNILRRRNRIFLRFADAFPPVKRFPQKSFGVGMKKPGFGSSTALVRPRRCTFSFPTRPTTSARIKRPGCTWLSRAHP